MGGWAIALHGGAGVISKQEMTAERKANMDAALYYILSVGVEGLERKCTAVEVVELVVKALEDNTFFNAGKGSVLTNKGTVEMEACIMDGRTKDCGAVSGLSTVVHPVSLARRVMEDSPHVYLGFDGAEEFARDQGEEITDTSFFVTEENKEKLERARKMNSVQLDFSGNLKDERVQMHSHRDDNTCANSHTIMNGHGNNGNLKNGFKANGVQMFKAEFETVGCVAVDSFGNCAAATSTGGLVNKMAGRIGDTPIVGAGTYANHMCGVSGTGRGEEFIKHTVAREVAALMEYKELPIGKAVHKVVHERLPKGMGGVIAVSATGEVAMAFNTPGMFRASMQEGGEREIAIW